MFINYWEVVSRNHLIANGSGDMLIRHPVMPGHVECCTKPVLSWIAAHCPRALVNIMDQYHPDHKVLMEPEKYPEIARTPSRSELAAAFQYADELGLCYRPVS